MHEIYPFTELPLLPKCYTEDYEFIYFSFDTTVGIFNTSIYVGKLKLLDRTEDERKKIEQALYVDASLPLALLLHYDALTLLGACRDELAGTDNRIISFTLRQLTDEDLCEDELKKWFRQLNFLGNLRLTKLDGNEINLMMKYEFGLEKDEEFKSSTRITFFFTRHLEEFVNVLLSYENTIEWQNSNRILQNLNELSNS